MLPPLALSTSARGDRDDALSVLTEDSDSDPGDDRIYPSALAFVAPGIHVRQSKMLPWWMGGGLGLFSDHPVKAGELLGFYSGTWRTDEEFDALPLRQQRRLGEYAVDVRSGSGEDLVVSPFETGDRTQTAADHPLCMANEAAAPENANSAFKTVELMFDEVSGSIPESEVDGTWIGLAVIACRDIGRGREITVHYGDGFRRTWNAGMPCDPPVTDPPTALGLVPIRALMLVPGSVSDSESSDESYRE